jgi:hypothetical protein
VKDFAIREDLLKQSVYSNEDITQQEDVHGDVGGGKGRGWTWQISTSYIALAMPALTLQMLRKSKLL